MAQVQQRVALVTGGARGLGRDIAEALIADDCSVFLVDILGDRLAETCAELRKAGATCETMVADVSKRENCQGAVDACLKAYGRIDVLVNCAAIVRFNRATEVPQEEFDRVMAINAAAPFWFCQAAIPHLIETKGNIVNITSQSGLIGTPYIVPYAMSKGAVVQMTRSLALEYVETPIRINAVSPGAMATEIGESAPMPEGLDMNKVARYSGLRPPTDASEVAALVAFVASSKASAIHGAILCADGATTTG